MIFWSILLLAIGLVAYKWFDGTNKKELATIVLTIFLVLIGIALVFSIIVFSFRGYVLKEESSKKIAKILIFILCIIIVGVFIYRTTMSPIIFDYSYIIHGLVSLTIFVYYNYLLHFKIFQKSNAKKAMRTKIEKEREEIMTFLNKNLAWLDVKELSVLKEKFEYKIPLDPKKELFPRIRNKLVELEPILKRKIEENELRSILERKKRAEEELRNIQHEKRYETMSEKGHKIEQLYKLKEKGNILKKEDLSEEEIELLLNNKYKQVNEYCVYDQKIITVLVQPVLNHSPTHIFLVWSVTKLLSDFGVTNLRTHDTREADITFTYKHQCYAIEIETGSLLTQRKQLEEKVKYLNRRYPKRWFFVVSNKNLQPKYRKYGVATQRATVEKFLKKLLKIRTQN